MGIKSILVIKGLAYSPGCKCNNLGSIKDIKGDGQTGFELFVDDQKWIIFTVPTEK